MDRWNGQTTRVWKTWLLVAVLAGAGCDGAGAPASVQLRPGEGLPDSVFVALVERISEEGGYFNTDNLISNEASYLKVVGTLESLDLQGGAYVGVGPDQNFSYIAVLRPAVAFITDIRRDNLLHQLLLKALVEGAETRVEFLSALHGRAAPEDPTGWVDRDVAEILDWVEAAEVDEAFVAALQDRVEEAVRGFGIPLSDEDLQTVRRFHRVFIDEGPELRFNTFGRPPRPYYPTYRQLLMETDMQGHQASYLADAERYRVVREMQLANRIVPVVGDLAGPHAIRAMGDVMREIGVELTAFYTSNVELYLWGANKVETWEGNLATLPAAPDAVIIRSYFSNFGGLHPSAIPGYPSAQSLQPVSEAVRGGFTKYWDAVTRGILELR